MFKTPINKYKNVTKSNKKPSTQQYHYSEIESNQNQEIELSNFHDPFQEIKPSSVCWTMFKQGHS